MVNQFQQNAFTGFGVCIEMTATLASKRHEKAVEVSPSQTINEATSFAFATNATWLGRAITADIPPKLAFLPASNHGHDYGLPASVARWIYLG
jgi:hypothetical protein